MFRFKSKEEKLRERFAKTRGEDYQGLLWSMLPEERKERVFTEWCNDYDVSIDDLDKSGSHVRENAIRDFEGYYYV